MNVDNRVHDIYEALYQGQHSAEWLNAQLGTLWSELGEKTPSGRAGYTRAQQAYVRGLDEGRHKVLWKDLEFIYVDSDGSTYSTCKGSIFPRTTELYKQGKDATLCNMRHAWVWKGTHKAFTAWKVDSRT